MSEPSHKLWSLKYFLHCNFSLTLYSGCCTTSTSVSSFMFPLYVTPLSVPTAFRSFHDAQLHYYIPLPSPYFILFALLPLYRIYISPPIHILARASLLFSLSLPSFSISSFVCYSWVFSQSLSPTALQYGVPDVLVSPRWI